MWREINLMQEDNDRAARLPVDEIREHLMVKIARMTYHMNGAQAEIGEETGLTRWQVAKLLKEAAPPPGEAACKPTPS
jgi:deoxyribonucleoside regulator